MAALESHLPTDSLIANPGVPASDAGIGPAVEARRAAQRGLYIHVPFCARRCEYCDFSTGSLSSAAVARYLAAMRIECERRAPQAAGHAFTSVFFGGGTPSALAPRDFAALWQCVRDRFRVADDAEITLEANPESVKAGLLTAWKKAGVNRLSMGAQSFDDHELRGLGRIHDAERTAQAFAAARAHGFERLSLDLMFAFPGHRLERWRATIERALELEPEHLSAYCFIPEAGTPLGDAVHERRLEVPSADAQAEAYGWLAHRLARAGFACYETSNFCRPGAEARHNLVYWLRRSYLGLGPSAHGLMEGVRYGNHYALARWAAALEVGQGPEAESERESDETVAREVMMLGLRLAGGLDERDHGAPLWQVVTHRYGAAFAAACRTSRLERTAYGVRVPAAHRFVADDVIAWIEAWHADFAFDSPAESFIPSLG